MAAPGVRQTFAVALAGPGVQRAMALGFLAILLSGCLGGAILGPTPATTRSYACAVLLPQDFGTLLVEVRKEATVEHPLVGPTQVLWQLLANITGRGSDGVDVQIRADLEEPDEGWTPEGIEEAVRGHTTREGIGRLALRIWWLDAPLGNDTGRVVAPGLVLVSEPAIDRKAGREPRDAVAEAVLLHHVGHALGQVNDGIPMQEEHEATPKHEGDDSSVMHSSWHDAGAPATTPVPGGFSDAVLADWQAATEPEGACT